MHIFWMLIVGLAVGGAARLLMPARAGGIIAILALGLAGSFVGGFIGRAVGWYRGTDPPGLVASVLGAILILFVFRLMVGWRRGSSAGV
jgi:uncharacterized membrane protein YeaQ/YmgE (transglycosylase-associated protein family)